VATVVDILDELKWRGLVALSTDEDALRAAFASGPVTFYVGFDPTAPSLHHGHLVQLLTARRLQQAGNRPLALVGGSTGLIGDPNPDRERTLNDPDVVAGWVEQIKRQVEPFFDFAGANAARMVNNLDWTAPLSAIEFLRDIGQHFRVNKMLAKEAVSARLNSEIGIGYPEFSYQILQALDYLELYRRYGCTLQTGGSGATSPPVSTSSGGWRARQFMRSRRRCWRRPTAQSTARPPAGRCGWTPTCFRRTASTSSGSTSMMPTCRAIYG
jgi:tyrosyl-tRNA synthetase